VSHYIQNWLVSTYFFQALYINTCIGLQKTMIVMCFLFNHILNHLFMGFSKEGACVSLYSTLICFDVNWCMTCLPQDLFYPFRNFLVSWQLVPFRYILKSHCHMHDDKEDYFSVWIVPNRVPKIQSLPPTQPRVAWISVSDKNGTRVLWHVTCLL